MIKYQTMQSYFAMVELTKSINIEYNEKAIKI